jgi:hypothetical protein
LFTADYGLCESVLDAIPLTGAHTSYELALSLAARISAHTSEEQILYGNVTDGASNVRKTAKMLLTRMAELDTISAMRPGPERKKAARELLIDFEEEVEEEEAEGEHGRATHCIGKSCAGVTCRGSGVLFLTASFVPAHLVNLAVGDALAAVAGATELSDRVHRVGRAVRGSHKRLAAFAKIQIELEMEPLSPIIPCVTRWNSEHAADARFCRNYDPLVVLYADGYMDPAPGDLEAKAPMLTRKELAAVKQIVEGLEPLKAVSLFVQKAKNLSLPHVPMLVTELMAALEKEVEQAPASAFDKVGSELQSALLGACRKRLGPIVESATPAIMAAVCHPDYGFNAISLFVPVEKRQAVAAAVIAKTGEWLDVLDPEQPIGTGPSDTLASFFADDDIAPAPGPAPNHRRGQIKRFFMFLEQLPENSKQHTIKMLLENESLSPGREAARLTRVYNVDLPADLEVFNSYSKLVLSAPSSSATSERVFWCSGRIDSPFRRRMSAENLEFCTIIQFFFSKASDEELVQFWKFYNKVLSGEVKID